MMNSFGSLRLVPLGCTLAGLALFGLCLPLRAVAGPKEEYLKLEEEMEAVQQQFLDALDAFESQLKKSSEGPTPPTDAPKPPPDGRVAVLKKMDDLAARVAGTPDAAPITFGAFHWAAMIDTPSAFPRFEKLSKQFPDEPALAELLTLVPEFFAESGTPEGWLQNLDSVRKTTKVKETQWSAAMAMGRIQLRTRKMPDAKASFELVRAAPDPDLAKAAKGFLFEIERLQVGMKAPDFTTKTIDGKEVSLDSLRGKAVLLNFWASW